MCVEKVENVCREGREGRECKVGKVEKVCREGRECV